MDAASEHRPSVPGGPTRFRAVLRTVVPESEDLGDSDWTAAEAIVARALAARPRGVRRQLGLFMRLLDVLAIVRRGRAFSKLPTAERFALLDSVSRSRVLLLRRGVWGLRTLALMGFYARPEAARAIGYRASPRGWADRRTPRGSPS